MAETPQMGWNSWNTFKDNFDQQTIEETADLLVSTGLRDAGYTVLTLDAGWQASERSVDGRQQAYLTKLPGGIKGIADYIHDRGLQFGIYSDAGIHDCGFSPGSWGYEELDAATYAEWTVDYLNVLTIIRKMREIAAFQKPGSWADMDMLEIGNGNMTLYEQQTHMSFWAALKSPLIIGADLRALSNESLDVLKNPDILAISQDSLGRAVEYLEASSREKEIQVWAGPLSSERTVILAFNEGNLATSVTIPLDQIPGLIGDEATFNVRDVWANRNTTAVYDTIRVDLETHQTKVLILQA
ncbi:hypothetical protein SLS57_008189 [Botryosphaeria dothidea]